MSRTCRCGCGAEVLADYKKGHNRRRPAEERFWEKVEVADCWIWIGAKTNGYGAFNDGSRIVRAHRWAYEALVGELDPSLHIDHLCRNPSCVNPDHLEPVTPRENTMRGYGQATRGVRGVAKGKNPDAFSYSAEYRRQKQAEYHADPVRRARKAELQRLRRARALLLEGGPDNRPVVILDPKTRGAA